MKSLSDIKEMFKSGLPGKEAQMKMMPPMRGFEIPEEFRDASVVVLLYEGRDGLSFLLIRRSDNGYVHGRQMGFPGGNVAPGESFKEAALRELVEEVSAFREQVEIVGELSALPIPVSGFFVHPFVAVTSQVDGWKKQVGEVEEIFSITVKELLGEGSYHIMKKNLEGIPNGSPYYLLAGQRVWGATAMILSELVELLRR